MAGHLTQAQRRERTRIALLDATIDCLVELGYAHTSMHEICTRAGVSKGAAQHHFTDKATLMAAAVEHLTNRRLAELSGSLDDVPAGPGAIGMVIDLLWAGHSGALATAATELWVAARTDPALRNAIRPVDRAIGHAALKRVAALSGDLPREQVETLFWLTVNFTRGLALDAELGGAPARRRQLLSAWKRIAEDSTVKPANGPARPSRGSARRP
jgi:AcrR family transcriptional regulator